MALIPPGCIGPPDDPEADVDFRLLHEFEYVLTPDIAFFEEGTRIFMLDNATGWAVARISEGLPPSITSETIVLKTIDGWQTHTSTSLPYFIVRDIHFTDADNGMMTGRSDGRLYITTDGGASWSGQAVGATDPLGKILAPGTGELWLAGNGYMLYSVNGGRDWTLWDNPDVRVMDQIEILDGEIMYVLGAASGVFSNSLFRSLDAGQTWEHLAKWINPGVAGFSVLDTSRILAIGQVLQASTDGGYTWTTRSYEVSGTSIQFMAGTGFIYGYGAPVYISADEGNSWRPARTADQSSIGAVDLARVGHQVFLIGPGGIWVYPAGG